MTSLDWLTAEQISHVTFSTEIVTIGLPKPSISAWNLLEFIMSGALLSRKA